MSEHSLVLVVDDDRMLNLLACEMSKKAGFAVIAAHDGKQALTLFHQHQPDVVLLDVCMPDMDGFRVCEQIRQPPESSAVPIIMMTGLSGEQSITRAYQAGATDFVIKPVQWPLLTQQLWRYVTEVHLERHPVTIPLFPRPPSFISQLL